MCVAQLVRASRFEPSSVVVLGFVCVPMTSIFEPTLNDDVLLSTKNAVVSSQSFVGVFAKTRARSATSPCEMKVFVPFRTYWSPSLTAFVSIDAASEPATGSVR